MIGCPTVRDDVWLLNRRCRIRTGIQALAIGCIWLMLTPSFEFLFGHYVMGHPWSRLLYDYDLFAGRVWFLVLVITALLSYTMFKSASQGINSSRHTRKESGEREDEGFGPSDASPNLHRATIFPREKNEINY